MTLQYVYDQHEAVAAAVAKMVPHASGGFGACKAIGVLDTEGRLIAGLVYHDYQPKAGTINLTGAAIPRSRWLTRETIRRMYEFPFLQIGCQMIMQITPAENASLLRQLAVYGYKFTTLERIFGRGRDGVVCQLTYEDWCDNRFNKRFRHHETPQIAEEAA